MENNIKSKPTASKKWLMRLWGILPSLFLMGLIFVIVTLFGSIKSEGERIKTERASQLKQKQPDVNVVVLEMIPATIKDRINLPGITEPWVKLTVLTEVTGKVIKKMMEEGNTVNKGNIIAVLDSRDYQNVYNSAKASHETAIATLNRMRNLHEEQLSTRSQLDEATAQAENYKSARDSASLNIERCTVRAPISGVINRLLIDNGQYLNMSDPVAEILQTDKIKVKVGIPESDVDAVRTLTNFAVTIDALNSRVFQAEKYFLSKTADAMARLYNLDLVLENPAGEILPDMFVRVEIVKKEVPESLSIPLYSIITRNNENIVYVVNENTAHSRTVEIGLQEGWRVEIIKGLSPGDKVIVVGHRSVNDGTGGEYCPNC